MAGEKLLDGLTLVLRRDDSDKLVKREDGKDGKVYGGRFHEGTFKDDQGDPINWVTRLQRTLAKRGFRLNVSWETLNTKTVEATFTPETEWAVREFQIAAGYPKALRADGTQENMPPGASYAGPISGVLNEETLSALKYWDDHTPPLICQIEISGFGKREKIHESPSVGDRVSDETNLWRDDAVDGKATKFETTQKNNAGKILPQSEAKPFSTQIYARDSSGEFPADRPEGTFHILGGIQRAKILGKFVHGPLTDSSFAWTQDGERSEVLPDEFVGASPSEFAKSTFRIIRAVADVECNGVFEGMNAYDDAIISVGLYHWTIKATEAGELPAFLAYLRQRDPVSCEKWFATFGLSSARVWPRIAGAANGLSLLQNQGGTSNFTYSASPALDAEDEPDVARTGFEERRYLRNLHAYYRCAMAARTFVASTTPYGYRRAMWDMARIRLQSLLGLKWPADGNFPFVGSGDTPATIAETFRSERTLALILRWHVKRPGHISDIDIPGGIGFGLKRTYAKIRNKTPFSNQDDVTTWSSKHEIAFADAIEAAFVDQKIGDVGNDSTMIAVQGWLNGKTAKESNYRLAEKLPGTPILTFKDEGSDTQKNAFTAVRDAEAPKQSVQQWVELATDAPLRIMLGDRVSEDDSIFFARINAKTDSGIWKIEVRDDQGGLLRRFHVSADAQTPTEFTVVEVPILSTSRLHPGTATPFEMDLSGLPRFKAQDDPIGPMVKFHSTAELNQLLDAGGDLTGDLWDLVHNAVTAQIPASLLTLPKPAVVELVETVETNALVVTKVRWHIATGNLNLEYLTLRRKVGSTVITVDWPGRSERYDGQVLISASPHVAALRRDLRLLGFRMIPPLTNSAADEQYDDTVKASVRTFQAYARRDRFARENSPATSPIWVLNLERVDVPHPLRYHGPVNGIVTHETRALIDHWLARNWRCPVVVDARTSPGGANNSIVPGKDNLWRFDEHDDTNHYFFVTDFSFRPEKGEPDPLPVAKPLAVYRNGPAVQNVTDFLPAKQEITVATMTPSSLPKTENMTSTVKVLRAVAGHLPCQGFLDGVNAADEQRVVNVGAMNLHENPPNVTNATKLKGRLGTLLCLSKELEPKAFGRSFGRDRIRSASDWNTNAQKILLDDEQSRLLTEVNRQKHETDTSSFKDTLTGADRPEWRGWHSVYRLMTAARQPGIGRAYYDIARLELAALGSLSISTKRLRQIVTSERAWAMLVLWYAKYPKDICDKRVPAQPLLDVAAAAEVVAKIVEKVTSLYTGPSPNPDQDFADRIIELSKDTSGLNKAPNSFKFDSDHLPHFKFKTGLLTALLNPSKKPAHISGPGLAASSGTTTTSLGFYGTADIENNKFHATHTAFTIADSNRNLQTLICPLLTERELDLELDEPEDFTTTVYRSPGQKEEALAVIRCKHTDSNKEQLKGDGDKWGFNPAAVLGTPAIPITAGFQFADLDFDADGFLTGKITADFGFQPPFGDPLPVSLGGVGNSSTDVAFSEFTLDENSGLISAPTTGLFKTLASFLNLPDGSEFVFTGAIDGDRFALSFATPKLIQMAMDLVPTLVSFDMENVQLKLDTRTGFGINLAEGIDRAKVGLASDLFANAGSDAVINHACESIADAAEDFGKLFKLAPDDANGILMEAGARLVSWDGRFPRLASALLGGLTKLEVNAARRLRSFAGELLGGLADRCHSKFDEAVGKSIRYGRDPEQGVWFVEVPLQMKFNDEANHGGSSDDADKRDFLKLTGWFRFTCPGDDDFVRFGAGLFCVDPEVVLEVEDKDSYKGRAFEKLVSLHIPDKSVFVFNTDPTQASIRWDVERSRAKQAEQDPENPDAPVKPFQKILIRVPASTGDIDPKKMSEPEAKRFTFEMNEFGVGVAGLDLAGQIRVESVSMNEPVAENDPDREQKILDEEGKTGLKAPLSIEKADSRPKDANADTPVVGEIRFTKSRLVFGSGKAGFQLRLFDNATGTIVFAMAEDLQTKKLSVTGTVEINTPVEYRLDELYATFQLKSVRLSTTCTIDEDKKVSWTSDGAIAGAVKFLPPAGKSADGPLAALSDFFSGVTCEFEDLNPVKLGRGASFTFNFPPKTFNLANVMEVDLNGITVGDNKAIGKNRFGLLGDVRLKDLPGVGGTLTFGGIDLTATDGFPELDIKRIGAALTLPGGIGIEAEFERIKNAQESGFAGRMTLKSESLPKISGLLKLTEVRCLKENRTVPSLALYLGASIDAPLVFGFYLRGLGMGLGIHQGLRGLRAADSNGKSITHRVMAFVDDPKGIPDPGTIEAWQPDAPDTVASRLNWMLVAQALITYGKFPPNKPHVITGTLLGALDQDLTLTLGTNIWLFASPEEITKPDFKPRPVARGAMQISPREGKVFAYFRTLPNPKLGSTAPELVTKVLGAVQTSCMFLADGNGFLSEVGWPWETKVDAAKIGIPSPLRGELSAGFRFGIYRGVVTYGLNFGIDVQMKADVGFDFNTPLGSAGAHLSVNGSGMFRASFIGVIDQALRPYLLGDVRVAAQVAVRVEAHCELSRKITKWCKIRLRIRFRESFNLSVTAALAAAMDSDGLGFSGDAHVAVSVSRYRISGRVPFQFNPNRVGSVRSRLDEILPKPIVEEGNQAFALGFAPAAIAAEGFALAAAEALEPTEWNYRMRQIPLPGTNRVRVLVALLPAPGVKYPSLGDADAPPDDRFSIKLKDKGPTSFKGFLLGRTHPLEGDVLKWHEDCAEVLMSVDDIRREYEQLDEPAPDEPVPEPLTVGKFLFGVGNADQAESAFFGESEVVDPRTQNPSATDADDETVGIAPDDHRSPNFGRNTEYDKRVATACSRQGEIQQGKSAEQAVREDNENDERIDGPSASMFAVEVIDLFGNDNLATRQDPTARENIPADLFLAQYLRSVLVFDLDESDEDVIIDELLDSNEFFIHRTDGLEKTPLKNGIPDDVGEIDLIVGHHFQSREMIGLCWDLRLEDKPDDPFAAYDAGFEYFRVTRTNVTRRTVKERVETITPCWLDPSKGARNSQATVLVRPQFQFVDRELGDPDDPNGDFREGDELSYRVEAVGPGVKRPTVCVFGIVRRTVRPLMPPVIAQALHQPRKGIADSDGMIADDGFIELSLVSPGDSTSEPRTDIPAEEVRVRYRLVSASSIGSYGFDSPVSATTRTESGLSTAASEGLGVQTIRFSASPQSRPLPWEETKELGLISNADWDELELPLPSDANQSDQKKFQTVLRLKTALKVTDVWQRIEMDHPDEQLHGLAAEFWIGRERERQNNSSDVNSPNGQNSLVDNLPIQRSVMVLCRHAVVLPNVTRAPVVSAISRTISKDYFTAGTTIAAIERMSSRAETPTLASRYLSPTMMHAELRGTAVPLGYDPSTPPTIPNPENPDEDIANPGFVTNDVRLALTWCMPPEPNTQPFDPVIAFRQYRVDRFNPVLHRIRGKSLEQRLERTVQVIPDQLYRSTPDLIEVLPISESGNGTTPTYRGDWRTRQPTGANDILQGGWGEHPLPNCRTIHPFTDDPDRAGSTFLHSDLVFFAKRIAEAIARANDTPGTVRPLWRVREPFEDRADLQAPQDGRLDNASDEVKKSRLAARQARFKAAFETFAAGHEADSDPYGWTTAESFGLSSEILFVHQSNSEPVNLDQLARRGTLRSELQNANWDIPFDPDEDPQTRLPPVVVLWFHADDGITLLNVVRLLYVGDLPGWPDNDAKGFNLRLATGLKFLGVDPALRNDKNDPDKWKLDYQFEDAGPRVFDWLNRNYTDRLRKGLEVPSGGNLSIRSGQILIYDRTLAAPVASGANPLAGALPIQEDGTVQLHLPVPDRLAHVFDIAMEPCRRYDAMWERLLVHDGPDGDPDVAELSQPIPFSRLLPVKVDRTRPLVPHNLIATPLQGAVQGYVFAHPAEFAACASAINAAAIEYSGHTVYLQRRIPGLNRIDEILQNRDELDFDWRLYQRWLDGKHYEQVEPANDEIARGREILLTPPPDDPQGPPISWNAMRTLPVTQVGIYGADRYVIPDVPAYYEYRFAAFSTAGAAQSPLAHTPFVKPLFDDVIQPVSSEGRMIGSVSVVNDPDSPLHKETILELEIVLGHPRLHLRPEMRGLWVSSDDTFVCPQKTEGESVDLRFGSLPDFELEYVLLFNSNFPDAFRVLNPLVSLIPPLDPQRKEDDEHRFSPLFLAKSPDDTCARVVSSDGLPRREAELMYVQNSDDGSIRLKLNLIIGRKSGADQDDTPKSRTLRELLRQARIPGSEFGIKPELFSFIVRRNGVQSKSPITAIAPEEVLP